MHILFITDNFPPEVNAPATRTYEHCREWVKAGAEVTVITCAPNFPKGKVYAGYRNSLYRKEIVDGIRLIRVWSYISANKGFLKRTFDFISFGVTSFIAALFVRCDVIIGTSPQFFAALSANSAAFWKRKPWIMEVRDLWPESIRAVDAMEEGAFMKLLTKLEMRMYKRAGKIVVVTESFKDHIAGRGIPDLKIHIIKNGANLDLFKPLRGNADLAKTLGLDQKFVVGYIGTHGMAHKLDFILECAEQMKDNKQLRFLFIGDGAEKEHLLEIAAEKRLSNVMFLDPVAKEEVPLYLSLLDMALIPLRKSDLFKSVLPSKIFETCAMQVPILLGVEGESKQLVEKYQAGICFEPENHADFSGKLLHYLAHRNELEPLYKTGCRKLAADYDRGAFARKMLEIISEAANE